MCCLQINILIFCKPAFTVVTLLLLSDLGAFSSD